VHLKFQEISEQHKNFTFRASADFDLLINLFCPKFSKKDATYREDVTVEERLVVTLPFLATGDSHTSLQYL
jgi:hypothetical protein